MTGEEREPAFFSGWRGGFAERRGGSEEGPAPLFLIAGPCALEGDDLNLRVAERLAEVGERCGVPVTFKASFDKANRSSGGSPRGLGLDAGLRALERVRAATGLPVLTDVHAPEHAALAAEAVDAVQIPAFLSRQTDLLRAAGAAGRPVLVKKGQWMAPEDVAGAAEKVREGGGREVAVAERGVAFGYGRWIVDMRSFALMREAAGCPTVFDASHAVQLPGGRATAGEGTASGGKASGGEPWHIGPLAAAAVAAGADGLFVETHPEPEAAPSDGGNMLPLGELLGVVERAVRVRAAVAG